MNTAMTAPVLERLVGPLSECLTPESARRLLALKADPKLQARVDYLAARSTPCATGDPARRGASW
jgi:hypothetical protein